MKASDLAANLLKRGVEISVISDTLGIDPEQLYRLRQQYGLTVPSDDITEAMSSLAWRAYEEGARILREGSPAQKMQLIRLMFSVMARQMGSQSPKETARLVDQFRDLIESGSEEDEDEEPPEPDESDTDEDFAVGSTN